MPVKRAPPIDLCIEAIVAGAGFSLPTSVTPNRFDPDERALSYNGTALLDIISPCVTFNNDESSTKSYPFGKDNEMPLHD